MALIQLSVITMKDFDPNGAAPADSGIFGLPYSVEAAHLVLLPVPWEATTSYGGGTSKGPEAIFHASKQVDLFDYHLGNFYTAGIAMLDESPEVQEWNGIAKNSAQQIIAADGDTTSPELQTALNIVNTYSQKLNQYVYTETKRLLDQGKLVGLIGGDHSTPFGAIQAMLEKHPKMGILHVDAHADMRKAYEGFEDSHASIMYNVITKTPLQKLVQVGIRDFCQEEFDFIHENKNIVTTFFDAVLMEKKCAGKSWATICDEIIDCLPDEVYVSFDIDGLDPRFCPHTGTPVPGGLDYNEVLHMLRAVVKSGRRIIGFDLNEVSPGADYSAAAVTPDQEWDANVAARLLYKLCGWSLYSSTKLHCLKHH